MSEIKIVLDAFSQSSSLDESIAKLQKVVDLTEKIKNNKDALKGGSGSGADVSKLVADNAKLAEQIAKVREAESKRQEQAKKSLKEESGLIGGLIKQQKELQSAIKSAATVDEVKKLNAELVNTKNKIKDISNAGKESSNTFGNALSSFQFKFNVLGQAIGQLAVQGLTQLAGAAKDFAKEAVHAFLDAELNAKKLEFAISNIAGEGKGSFKKLIEQSEELQKKSIFSDDDIQKAQTALAQYGLTSDEIEKLIPKVIDLASAQGTDLASATETSIKAIEGQTKGLKTAGIAFTDTGTKAGNLAKLTEGLTKFQGASNDVMDTHAGKIARLKNAYDDLLESVGEELVDAFDNLSHAFESNAEVLDRVRAKVAADHRKQYNEEIAYESTRSESARRKEFVANQNELARLLEQRRTAIHAGAELVQKDLDRQIAYIKGINDAIFQSLKNTNLQKESDSAKTDKKIQAHSVKTEKETTKELKKVHLDRAEELSRVDLEGIEKTKDKQVEENGKKNAAELAMFEAHQEALENDKRREQELYAKRVENASKFAADVFGELEELSKKREDLLDKEIDKQDKQIDRQRELAEKGQANTLAFEEKRKADLERQKINEEKKQERLAKTQAFFNAFASYSKDEPQTAAAKALKDVLLAEVVAKAFAKDGGIVGEIAEPIGGSIVGGIFKGRSHAQGGIHLEAEGEEGILSKKQMANLGVGNFHALQAMLNSPVNDDLFARQNDQFLASIPLAGIANTNYQLLNKIDELKKTIEDKKETEVMWDTMGNLVITEKAELKRTITKYQRSRKRLG